MASVRFAIVDVFSSTPFKGNPLAVVEDVQNALTETQMKLITRQFNLSETTFFSSPTNPRAAFRLRSFLPDGREVFGAGHNILGAWWYLANSDRVGLSPDSSKQRQGLEDIFTVLQELGEEIIPVRITKKEPTNEVIISMRQIRPVAHALHPDPKSLAAAINVTQGDLGFVDTTDLPPQVMSTSTTRHLLVPLSSIEALDQVVVQRDKLLEQLSLVDAKAYGLYLFAQVPGHHNTYQARFFSPGMNAEDPATGSAAGPLSAYLHNHGILKLVDGGGEIQVYQGLRVGRECLIRVRLSLLPSESGKDIEVDIIGSGVQVAEGNLRVPAGEITF